MANSIKLDDRYSVLYGSQILLFDNRLKKAVPLDPEVAPRLTDLAKLGRELAGLGATMTITFTLPGAKEEIRLSFEPAAEDIVFDEDE